MLCHGARVNLERVHVAGVPGHHHVVPLVVVQWLVRVALHQRRPVAQVEHVVDVANETEGEGLELSERSHTGNLGFLHRENGTPPQGNQH